MVARAFGILFLLGALGGLVFSSLSTSDFVQHLDRQVHAIHCSFVPGAAPSTEADSGCHVALMSPWSSVLRGWLWGGLPIALPGIAVFAFLLFRGIELWAVRGFRDRQAALFLFAATLLPVFTSIFFAGVAIVELDAFCKTCAGIYASSALCLVGAIGIAIGSWWPDDAPSDDDDEAPAPAPTFEHPALMWAVGAGEAGAFVVVPVLVYVLALPDHSKYVGACGTLAKPEVPANVLVPMGRHRGGKPAIEVFDPLCPACRGFEARLESSGLDRSLDRQALLFPLDDQCNWNVSSAIHPGACTVSEAVLCSEKPQDVIDWAFEHQEEIRTASAADPKAAERLVVAAFPDLKKCVGSAKAKQQLNRALRWAANNQLPVLTPQLYVDGVKLCDEDTDLGMDYALSRLLARNR